MARRVVMFGASLVAASFCQLAYAEGPQAADAPSQPTSPAAPSTPVAASSTPAPNPAPAASAAASSTNEAAPAPTDEPAPPTAKPAPPINESDKGLWDATPAERRSGFTAGLMGGLSFGNVIGYPNDFSKVDKPAYRSATSGVGTGAMLYLGGTLTDWFTFSVGYQSANFGGSDNVTTGWAILFHTEMFPLYSLGQVYRDIGVFADAGTGMAKISRRTDGAEYSSSGSLSIGALGAFWETWRLAGHVALGPFLSGQYERSDSVARFFGQLGIRASVYGGP